ncbi:MAG: DUF3108 domain-containing protein [Candidatus Omnitrophica bacterium]|nr:DUF3108 domain-containing protein [Candidatus Omnitrophota bacterium]
MKRLFKFILSIVIFVFLVSFVSGSLKSSPEAIIKNVFKPGQFKPQILKYRIYVFGIFPVGEAYFYKAILEKVNGKDLYHVQGKARSLDVIATFFKSEATLDSYIDPVDSNPVLFKQKISISGKPNEDKEVIYDQKQGFMIMGGSKRQILPNTQDPLSLAFNLERMDFDKSKEIDMNINTKHKNYLFKGSAEEKPDISRKISRKVYLAKAEIRRRDKNNPYHQSKVTIWFVRGEENIPILVRVFASGFIIQARLVDVK